MSASTQLTTKAPPKATLKTPVALIHCTNYQLASPSSGQSEKRASNNERTNHLEHLTPPAATDSDSPLTASNATDAVYAVLNAIQYQPAYGEKILLKPNLLAPSKDGLCCTHPTMVTAACAYIRDHGGIPTVGDSPAFGSAIRVAQNIKLDVLLKKQNIPLITLESPVTTTLPSGLTAYISRHALETDSILNIPRLKAHSQFRITCGMKNLFGCVSGVRKALAHSKHGDKQNAFRSMLIEIHDVLPPVTSLLDGIVVMEGRGPSGGDPFPLGIVGASNDTVALDTAVYTIIRATPQNLPLWQELQLREKPTAFYENLEFPLAHPSQIDGSKFRFPAELRVESFHPAQLLRSAIKRIVMRYFK